MIYLAARNQAFYLSLGMVISPQGKLPGRVLTGKATANVAMVGKDPSVVFLTAHDTLLSLKVR